jgi:hypothetical protein
LLGVRHMKNDDRTLAGIWASYEQQVMPADATEVQRKESRDCFYAGAGIVFNLLMHGLSEGAGETPEDLALLDNLHAEIRAFETELALRVRAKLGRRMS